TSVPLIVSPTPRTKTGIDSRSAVGRTPPRGTGATPDRRNLWGHRRQRRPGGRVQPGRAAGRPGQRARDSPAGYRDRHVRLQRYGAVDLLPDPGEAHSTGGGRFLSRRGSDTGSAAGRATAAGLGRGGRGGSPRSGAAVDVRADA